MKKTILSLALLGSLSAFAQDFPDWDKTGYFSNTEQRVVSEDEIYSQKTEDSFKGTLNLTLVIFNGTDWTEEEVITRLKKTARSYLQCEIKVTAHLVTTDPFLGRQSLDNYFMDALMINVPEKNRPILFYLGSTPDSAGLASSLYDEKNVPQTRGSAWFPADKKQKLVELYGDDFTAEAHELGHILLEQDHVDIKLGERNFLAAGSKRSNNEITAEQCDKILNNPLVVKP